MENVTISFYLKWEEPINATLQALQRLILGFDSRISETSKYGMVCFVFEAKPKFYLGIDLNKNNQPYVLFVDGNHLQHDKLEAGSRKKMKIYRVDPVQDINMEELSSLLKLAINLPRK